MFPPKEHFFSGLVAFNTCTIIEGDFELLKIEDPNIKDDDFPTFSNLREITGSLFVYQVR